VEDILGAEASASFLDAFSCPADELVAACRTAGLHDVEQREVVTDMRLEAIDRFLVGHLSALPWGAALASAEPGGVELAAASMKGHWPLTLTPTSTHHDVRRRARFRPALIRPDGTVASAVWRPASGRGREAHDITERRLSRASGTVSDLINTYARNDPAIPIRRSRAPSFCIGDRASGGPPVSGAIGAG
jgi:hypothetical protein